MTDISSDTPYSVGRDTARQKLIAAALRAAMDLADGDRADALRRLKAMPHQDLALVALSAIQTTNLLVTQTADQLADQLTDQFAAERAAKYAAQVLTDREARGNRTDLAAELARDYRAKLAATARRKDRLQQQVDASSDQTPGRAA